MQNNSYSCPAFQPLIELKINTPVLYSADFEVLKYHFSGLIAFRSMIDSNEIRIVFLSEVGIKVIEFKYTNGILMNTYCIESLKRKAFLKFVGNFVEMLLNKPDYRRVCSTNSNNKSTYFCRSMKSYSVFEYSGNNIERAIIKEGKKKKAEGTYRNSLDLPEEIVVQMKYNTLIQMKKVNNAFK
jgi:hypothetical protein